ncbi:MAG: hypothetical protein HDR01_04160 [Lachnospiraceae bacterium]|nr:hypothetical protein [Lachnospiraceae bacterium]
MKKIIRTVALVSAMSMLVGGTVFATSSKMVTKSGDSTVISTAAIASCSGSVGSYEFKPNTNESLKGGIRQYSPGGVFKDVVGLKKYSTRTTGSFYQEANYSYRVHLSDGYGYGVVTVQ